jgi:probable rRNA maturation factor
MLLSALFLPQMILIEPDSRSAAPSLERKRQRVALKIRDLRGFLLKAKDAVGLDGEVSVLLASDGTIRALNKNFRKKDKATDVLSFPADAIPGDGPKQAGDLAISLDTAQKQADEHGHSLQIEVKVLMLHGLLHLAGFDHETDKGQMARKENALRKELELPLGLIERSSGKLAAPKKKAATRARSKAR